MHISMHIQRWAQGENRHLTLCLELGCVCVCWGGGGGGGGGGGVGALYPAHRRRNQGAEGAVPPQYLPGKSINFSITLMNTQFREQICPMCCSGHWFLPTMHSSAAPPKPNTFLRLCLPCITPCLCSNMSNNNYYS